VLMLTNNRVGSFDEAFRSRIHISLYYPKLGKEETPKIWEMNLRRIREATDVDIDIDEDGITKFYKKHWKTNETKTSRRWNGRHIRNAFQTALALANWDFHSDTNSKLTRPSLHASHFKQVAETSNHFDD
jgi:SpoVK/Ycf46/Vps4 family AAA+-type ATPase